MGSRVYRYYVLGLLMVIYAFNFLDRQVVTIVAPYLKADLGVSDAQIGLLFGTAFALFYAVFGLPLAKLADGWSRVRTISLGLSFWSLMTAISGMATSYAQLGAARVGVGVGEASASPASYSLLQDYFPKSMRATVLALYSSGIYLGAGAALIFGGEVIKYWEANYTAATAPFGLSGWQATYFAFGIPGLVLAMLMIFTVKEPVRGAIDGIPTPGDPHPVRSVFQEFGTMIPPWNLITLWRKGEDWRPLASNIILLGTIIAAAWGVIEFTDGLLKPEKRAIIGIVGGSPLTTNMVQWIAIAVGVYCASSWFQSVRLRDAPAHQLIANRGFVSLAMIGGLMSFISYGHSPFIFLYAKQHFSVGAESGLTLGIVTAICGGLGATFGGIFGDWFKKRHPAGRIIVMLVALLGSLVSGWLVYQTDNIDTFFLLAGINLFVHIMWLGPCAASIQDLVLPRMRGTATAVFFIGTSIVGLGLGPYVVGLISDVTGDLRFAMLSAFVAVPAILIFIAIAYRSVPKLEADVVTRARSAGEAL
jgi:MFS family permease